VKIAIAATFVVALICSTQPCLSENIAPRWKKTITEEDVRILSARLYRDILITACKNGWRYPRKQLEHGFKRHFRELKLQLSSEGYRIVSAIVAGEKDKRPTPMARVAGHKEPETFGCARRYWLETRR
jgi:hypothetical protein